MQLPSKVVHIFMSKAAVILPRQLVPVSQLMWCKPDATSRECMSSQSSVLLTTVQVKLIAEPWDCGGLYQVGGFPNWDVWGEWNGKYRDDVRRFIKGDAGMKSAFATRIAGSADLYHVNNRRDNVRGIFAYSDVEFTTSIREFETKACAQCLLDVLL